MLWWWFTIGRYDILGPTPPCPHLDNLAVSPVQSRTCEIFDRPDVGPQRTAFAWPRSYSCFSDCDNGCTKTPTIERSDRHPPRPRLQDPAAAPLLPTVQHGRAVARDLPELRLLYGPRDRYAARVRRYRSLPRCIGSLRLRANKSMPNSQRLATGAPRLDRYPALLFQPAALH
jgi:hypothetical protein